MAINRRAFVFSVLAVLMVAAMVVSISSQDRMYPRTLSQTNRVHIMDSYFTNLAEDLPRAAYIACFRSLIALEEYMSSTGVYLTDFETPFASLFSNGTLNGTAFGIMNQSSFVDFEQRFQALADTQGIMANLSVVSVNATQSDPWHIDLQTVIEVTLRDKATSVAFITNLSIVSVVPIEDIKDPLHTIGTQGKAPHVVRQSNLSRPFVGPGNNTALLQQLVNNTWYVASPDAPSFLQRFEGNFSADPNGNGIVSLVNIKEQIAQGLPVDTCKSVADYIYFGTLNSDPNSYVENMNDNEFWLDNTNLAVFDASGSVSGSAPCP